MKGAGLGIPDHWYNVTADFPELHEPYVDPATGKPSSAQALEELFVPELVAQELDTKNRYIRIPEEILERYASWRPTPLLRAKKLEAALGTRCRILYKYEGASPIGSHKANSGVAQAYYAKRGGRKRVFAETGAGQWGSAISMGSSFSGIACDVFMVGGSYDAKAARRILMETFGSNVHRSPSNLTGAGRKESERQPQSPGSLGLAIAEAIEATRADKSAAYALGSSFGFVCTHQTVIGQELKNQLVNQGLKADVLISCIGGGSSFAGLVFPFLEGMKRGHKTELLAVESNAVPKVTQGKYAHDYGDSSGQTPLIKMYTLGHSFAAPSIHAGGLRYHGLAPQVSKLIHRGLARGEAYSQLEVYASAKLFAECEGIIPAPEAAHSIAAACNYARNHKTEEKTIVFCLTGHGFFDLAGYDKFNRGEMKDSETPKDDIVASLASLKPLQISADSASRPFDRWRQHHFGEGARGAGKDAAESVAPAGAEMKRDAQAIEPTAPITPPSTDLSDLKVITERVVRESAGTGPLVVNPDAVVTPAAVSEARLRRREIVRSGAPAKRSRDSR